MKKIAILGAVLVSSAAMAQTNPSRSAGSGEGPDPNHRICRSMGETGSRLGGTRVCMTRSQWEAQRRDSQTAIERAQTNRVHKPNG